MIKKNGNTLPLISIVISCRNEEKCIGKCFDSILSNDYPKDRLEVLAIDGQSEDKTRDIILNYTQKHQFIKLLHNPQKITPVAMNFGIKNAIGDIIILVNAHSMLDKKFLKYSVEYLEKTNADAVGGMLSTINENNSLISEAIPLAVDSIFGSGGRRYRSRTTAGYVNDTLPYCAYPKTTFDKYGYIDEELIRDQDEEFNYRIQKKGGKIFFTPQIKSYLWVRGSLNKVWKQHFQYGYFKPLVSQKVGATLTWRQLIPGIFVGSLIATGITSFVSQKILLILLTITCLYLLVNVIFSTLIAMQKGWKNFFALPIIFTTLHFSYGLGYLKGIGAFLILKIHKKRKLKDMSLSR